MIYEKREPTDHLKHLIKGYWQVDSEGDETVVTQKIIPDGYTEIIFHYGAPFEICLYDGWERQSMNLLAGQVRHHFFLRNTGAYGMLGVKLMPTALAKLFGLSMLSLTDKVVALHTTLPGVFRELNPGVEERLDAFQAFNELDKVFEARATRQHKDATKIDLAIENILASGGTMAVKEIANNINVSLRQLERLFGEFVGLSPKYYSRIIRFNKIFDLIQTKDPAWVQVALDSGHFDQSHFIKNFKAFSGEDPSAYVFDQLNMANFFLNK